MKGQEARIASQALGYIEENLDKKLELETIAAALHYSKYHLHRSFAQTVGMTMHAYVQRRRLTEAARLLVFSRKPIWEIAYVGGYESQQAFTSCFKEMYKKTPAQYRTMETFYPLQFAMCLDGEPAAMDLEERDVSAATPADMDDWMELARLTVDGYPCLNEAEYRGNLYRHISSGQAFILRDEGRAAGVLAFTAEKGWIDFLAVHPQYRSLGIAGILLNRLRAELPRGAEISVTTYREGDRADTGYRKAYLRLGFEERELLTEYGYPTQRFVLPSERKEAAFDDADAG